MTCANVQMDLGDSDDFKLDVREGVLMVQDNRLMMIN